MLEFTDWSNSVASVVQNALATLDPCVASTRAWVRSLSSTDLSVLFGDVEHVLYFCAGFIALERSKVSQDLDATYSIDFELVWEDRAVGIYARLFTAGLSGSTMYGLTIVRLNAEQLAVANARPPDS
ncbi:MAG: hypothetical protein R3E77_10260 [Steroidobacteraceae bacterium]